MLADWLAAIHLVTNGVHQVGFAHSHAAIEEERVVGPRGRSATARDAARQLVAIPDDERVEGVARVELRRS